MAETTSQRGSQALTSNEAKTLSMRLLLLVPKNLVYVFVLIILFAFGGMMYITYTEKNMGEFLTYNRTQEVVVVDPLFTNLQAMMHLDEYKVPEENDPAELDTRAFNNYYMSKNRPVVIRGMAKDWGATQKWKDSDYLIKEAGTSTSLVSILT